jgi:glycine dehydrogenase subunit 2
MMRKGTVPTIFERSHPGREGVPLPEPDVPETAAGELEGLLREGPIGLPEVTEGQCTRHYVTLSCRNYHIEQGIYPLGSCTMKYNPKAHEAIARLPGFCDLHPELPDREVQGTLEILYRLSKMLNEITGFAATSLHPAAGAQGELTGLMVIKSLLEDRGEKERDEVLMPDSAHGTNPASAVLAGMKVVNLSSDDRGLVDMDDLRKKAGPKTAALMLTNPNTLGLFESDILEITRVVHEAGGRVYMDGANMNALMGIARPGDMGFDVCHLNLHKTFSTPHGGGGPGSGPVCCTGELSPYLPHPRVVRCDDGGYRLIDRGGQAFGRLLAFAGNVAVCLKAFAYILSMGPGGMRRVSEDAVINANYLKALVSQAFEVPYDSGPCMHEFVASGSLQKEQGAATMDIAKRLLDYGYHAPTVYFPLIVREALMIEPTETESMESLDGFAEAMLSIAEEAESKPHLVTDAPVSTPVMRLDEVRAVKELCVVEPWNLPERE